MSHIIAQTISYNNEISKKIVVMLLAAMVCIVFLYGFFVRETILNVVAREKVNKEASVMLSSIAALEAKYMNIKENISLDLAYAQGFKDAGSPDFITRGPLGKIDQLSRIQ